MSPAAAAMEQMITLADSVEARVSKLILILVKIEKDENDSKKKKNLTFPSDKYKNMYRKVLEHKMMMSGNNGGKSNDQEEEGSSESEKKLRRLFDLLQTLSAEK